jgi:hypothetical protein
MKPKLAYSLIVLVAVSLTLSLVNPAMAASSTTMAVTPTATTLESTQVGQTFQVNIIVTDVTDLWAWAFRINWNPQILNITNVTEGPFLQGAGQTFFLWPGLTAAAIHEGYMADISAVLMSQSDSVNGSGVLATVTFKVLASGTSTITINQTLLTTYDNPIPHTTIGGYVTIPVTFPVQGQNVQISSNSTITNFQFSGTSKKISFDVSGADGTEGFANITIPKALLSGDFTVYLDQTPLTNGVNYTLTSDTTYNSLNVNYSHSTHKIEVVGTQVIPSPSPTPTPSPEPTPTASPTPSSDPTVPEFPATLVLPLFLVGVGAVSVALMKRNPKNAKASVVPS